MGTNGAPAAAKPTAGNGTRIVSLLASVLPIIVAIALYYHFQRPPQINVPDLISSLTLTSSGTQPSLKRVSVGYNSNLDLIVDDAVELFTTLQLKPAAQVNHASIASREQLEETVSYFFARGSAGERFIEDATLFDQIITAARTLDRKHYFIGGNSALMAQRFAEKGCEVHLGGAIGSTLKKLLHKSIWTESKPDVVDEVHLILEYKTGAKWDSLEAPRANRFIVVRDLTNGALAPLEEFHAAAAKFAPQLIIIAGLHLLEGQPATTRNARLNDVVAALRASPASTPLHFELASIGSISFLAQVLNAVLPEVDSLGLNEQELGTSYVALGGRDYNASHFVNPTPEVAAAALLHVMTSPAGQRRLSRIHFHSLGFHVIAVREGSKLWSEQKARTAVAAASLATTRQACDSELIDPSKVDVLLPSTFLVTAQQGGVQRVKAGSGVSSWTHKSVQFFLAPVLVCRRPLKTVGLGDIISATGLLYNY